MGVPHLRGLVLLLLILRTRSTIIVHARRTAVTPAPLACGESWPSDSGTPRPCREWTWRCNATRLGLDAKSVTRWAREPSAAEPSRYVLRVNLPGCATDVLTSRNVAACLRGRHVVFFGDSLTRYQYISLALFLEYGTWSPPPGGVKRAYEYVQGWGGYNGLSKAVAERLRGHEICDCHRPEGGRKAGIFETRYYYNPALNIRITFVWRTGTLRMMWHHRGWIGERCQHAALERARVALAGGRGRPPPPVACSQTGCRPGACTSSVHGRKHVAPPDDFVGALTVLQQLRPDAAVFNAGLWTTKYETPEVLARLIGIGESLQAELGAAAPLLVWRTTTARQAVRGWKPQPIIATTLATAGWTIVDAGGATEHIRTMSATKSTRFYYDNSHFKRFVYRGINELILAGLCSASTRW